MVRRGAGLLYRPRPSGPPELVLIPALLTTLVLDVARRREPDWRRSLGELEALARAARAGEAPIEELCRVDDEIRPVASVIHDLLHDVREGRRINAELRGQILQRVAQRTDALQRTIGSLKTAASIDKLTGVYNRWML